MPARGADLSLSARPRGRVGVLARGRRGWRRLERGPARNLVGGRRESPLEGAVRRPLDSHRRRRPSLPDPARRAGNDRALAGTGRLPGRGYRRGRLGAPLQRLPDGHSAPSRGLGEPGRRPRHGQRLRPRGRRDGDRVRSARQHPLAAVHIRGGRPHLGFRRPHRDARAGRRPAGRQLPLRGLGFHLHSPPPLLRAGQAHRRDRLAGDARKRALRHDLFGSGGAGGRR